MKIAIISDLHISTRWIGEVSIIDQSIKLAKELVTYCKSNDIHHLFIAGDIVDKSMDKSEVFHAAKDVFKIFSDYFDEVRYILGQHDCSENMVGNVNRTASLVNLFDYQNVIYSDGIISNYDGVKVGFANFSRNSEYKLPEYVDLYITHFTISNRFGQKIDNSKFGVMIAGDIHHKVNINNMHSIGSFQQQSVTKDSEWNNVCIFDTSTRKFDHINLDAGIILRNSDSKSGMVDGIWYELKRKVNSKVDSNIVKSGNNYTELVKRVEEFLKDKCLNELNDEVNKRLTGRNTFSTEFTIKSINIHNYLKIKDFSIEFNENDRILLTGLNGSGKSTFLNALFAGLTGNLTWNHVIGRFDTEVSVTIELSYLGVQYTLRRGSGLQKLVRDGSEVPYKNRNDFNSVVVNFLPFLPELGILFQRPNVGTLFETINSNAKLNLISKVYHLEYLDQLYETGNILKQSKLTEINGLESEIKVIKSELNNLISELNELSGVDKNSLESMKSRYNELINLQSKAEEYRKVSKEVNKLKSDIDANLNLINESTKLISSLDSVKYENSMTEFTRISSNKSSYDYLMNMFLDLDTKESKLDKEIESISNGRCPKCHQIWITEESRGHLKILEKTKEELLKSRVDINSKLSLIDTSEFNSIDSLKSYINNYDLQFKSSNLTISKCNARVDELTKELNSLNVPEEVNFSEDDLNELIKCKDEIGKITKFIELENSIEDKKVEILNLSISQDKLRHDIDDLNRYTWYVCKSGPIYKDIISELCDSWSNDKVKFELFEGVYRGNDYLDINIFYLKGSEWQNYNQSSSGEKSYMDILFIKSVTANAGFLILDEFLRHMDSDLTNRSIDEISQMNVNLFILSSFNPNLYFNNRNIRASYIPESDECRLTIDDQAFSGL